MKFKGVLIPGLSMEKLELPDIHGFQRLQNPEVNDGITLGESYTVEEIAEIHLKTISTLSKDSEFNIVGMSLGGMITSVLASHFRSLLPPKTRFYFLVTIANLPSRPALTRAVLESWKGAVPGDVESFAKILSPFFSPSFLEHQPLKAQAYFSYRALGHNRQSPKAFMKQVGAIMSYNGQNYYPQVDPAECHFIHAAQDLVLTPDHAEDLKKLVPEATHHVAQEIGHMINIESPESFHVK